MDPDDFDLDDIFGTDDDRDAEPEPPDLRITLRAGQLYVEPWAPWLWTEGPVKGLIRDHAADGVTVADAWLTGDDSKELIVRYHVVASRARADRRLIEWAESVGHRRIWFPDRLVAIEQRRPLGIATVRCPTCGAEWCDGSPNFWQGVRGNGRFPTLCVICNGDLPQWRWRPRRSHRTLQTPT